MLKAPSGTVADTGARYVVEMERRLGELPAPVLTEATHLLGRLKGGREACLDFFLSGGALLVPASSDSLRRSRDLVRQYSDLPMDYADATLVALAEELGTNLVFTTDRRDFGVYRLKGRRRFQILPG